jgi:Domain of unknown function (DUF4203)
VNSVIPQSYQPLMLGLMVVSGLIAWAAGYRLFRLVLTLNGFIFGAWVTTAMFGASDRTLLVFAALGGGAVGALIMFFGYFVGVALAGAGIGALAAHMFWSRFGADPHPVVVILAAVAGAASAMALQRYVIVIATAFAGAWTLLLSGLTLSDRGQKLASAPEVWILYPLDPSPSRRWVLMAWVVLGFAGVFVQLRFTGREKKKPKAVSKPKKSD